VVADAWVEWRLPLPYEVELDDCQWAWPVYSACGRANAVGVLSIFGSFLDCGVLLTVCVDICADTSDGDEQSTGLL